ncbi:MAG: hypothetical protein DDT40_00618 [candidate division WS2 bacterium]|nr:hypothetical protein [Candidatus Psychracetigena formicireducens]
MDTTSKKLERFVSIVEKIKNSRFIKETKSLNFELKFEIRKPLTQIISGYDEEDFRSVLMDLRKFFLEKDGVEFKEICDLVYNNTGNQTVKDNITKCKSVYDQLLKNPIIKILINGKEEETDAIIKRWLYGHYIHEQEKNIEALNELGIGKELHKYNFLSAIVDLIKLSVVIANNTKVVLSENNQGSRSV